CLSRAGHRGETHAGAGAGGAAAPLSGHSPEHVPHRDRGARPLWFSARGTGGRRETVRTGPHVGEGAEPDHPPRVRRVIGIPDRPLPRQGGGAGTSLLPVSPY